MATYNTPTITFTAKAFERIRENMDVRGKLENAVRVRVECVRAVWVVDAKDYVRRDDVTLPKGYDMESIEELIVRVIQETYGGGRSTTWHMPPLSTIWLCDDGCNRTLGEMLAGFEDNFIPRNDRDVLMVLERYGADWTSPVVTHSFMQHADTVAVLNDLSPVRNPQAMPVVLTTVLPLTSPL